jgi:small subunit ribosomal protein S4e
MWTKRLTVPKWWPIEKKTHKFVVSPRGPHKKLESLPLTVFVRDVLKLAETGKEARHVIKKGEILVDGKKTRDYKLGVGLLDSISIPSLKRAWRIIPYKGGLSLIEIPYEEASKKICKIVDKKILKKNKTQLNLFDGKNILSEEKFSTHDSLLLSLPDLKVLKHLKFEKGALCLVIKGGNAGRIAKIEKIEKDRVWMEDKNKFEVPKDLVFVIGKNESEIKVSE